MSEPTRYHHFIKFYSKSFIDVTGARYCYPDAGMTEDKDGKYVEYEEYARLKAEVERLTKAVKCGFHGGNQLLCDLNKLLTAHRHYCWVNAIDYTQMEKDALNAAKEGKGQP